MSKGKLYQINVPSKTVKPVNLGFTVEEVLALYGNSVYFKDQKSDVYFVDLDWISDTTEHKQLIQKPIFKTQSVLNNNFTFDMVAERIASWVDPYRLKLFPPLNYN